MKNKLKTCDKNKRILFLVNHDIVIYNFRRELVERLITEGFEIYISSPNGERIQKLKQYGCHFIETKIHRHGVAPSNDYKLFKHYYFIIKKLKPLVVLTYTIKPNIYGALAARFLKVPCISNITGLGIALEYKGILQQFTVFLYKIAFTQIHCVFFQNLENMYFFKKKKIAVGKHRLLPGSGVNLIEYQLLPFPETMRIAFISRIMKDKGIEEFLKCAEILKQKYPDIYFDVCGFCEERYEHILKNFEDKGVLIYHGMVSNIKDILYQVQCVVLPSYHEGMSNVLLEAAASGRIILASDIPGCHEIIDEGINGYCFPVGSLEQLQQKLETIIHLSLKQKIAMGLAGRKKVEQEFDREQVVDAYLDEIRKICGGTYVAL